MFGEFYKQDKATRSNSRKNHARYEDTPSVLSSEQQTVPSCCSYSTVEDGFHVSMALLQFLNGLVLSVYKITSSFGT